jgi:hypothetical protein
VPCIACGGLKHESAVMCLSFEQWVTAISRHEFDIADTPLRYHSRRDYRHVLRLARNRAAVTLDDSPDELLAASGLEIVWTPMPGRCGMHLGRYVHMSWHPDPATLELRKLHEWVHWALGRAGYSDATEADAWHCGIEWVRQWAWQKGGPLWLPRYPWAPAWLLAEITLEDGVIPRA